MSYVGSCIPTLPLENAQGLVTVCKTLTTYVVPNMCFSWRPHDSALLTNSLFAKRCVSRIVSPDLQFNATFQNTDLKRFTHLKNLCLASNGAITNQSLSGLTNLTLLDLFWDNDEITQEGYAHLTNLTSIRGLK